MNKLVILFVVLGVFILVFKFFPKPTPWTLFICKEAILETGILHCQQNEYELKGYKTQADCMEKGIGLSKGKDFECGKNCNENKEGFKVCDEICNKYKGCN